MIMDGEKKQIESERAAENRGIVRRDFVVGSCSVVALIALGGAVKATASQGLLLRPPGGQDEERLIASCLRCNRCYSVCPRRCISPAGIKGGFLSLRTPMLDFHQGYCDFCNLCIENCPTDALLAFSPENDRMGIAVIDPDRCLAWQKSGCSVCIEACEYGAIVGDERGAPVVVAELCNGCGRCEYVCPSNSFRSYSGDSSRGIEVKVIER